MAAVVSRWKWRWSIEGNCPCINGGLHKAGQFLLATATGNP